MDKVERLYSMDDGQVIREIIPGGSEPRQYRRYENQASALMVQRLDRSRFVPKLLVALVDDGIKADSTCLDNYPPQQSVANIEEARDAA